MEAASKNFYFQHRAQAIRNIGLLKTGKLLSEMQNVHFPAVDK